ncbi:hypothetical protein D9M73_138640 [compost metagenome]
MDFMECPQIAGMKGAMAPVMAEILDQKNAQPIEQGQRQVLLHLRARAPQPGEEGDVVRRAQHVRIDQTDDGQHQGNLEDGEYEVVAVVEQRRAMQVHPAAANELPE